MKMRIFRDGVVFAEGSSLLEIADFAGEDVSRYSFDREQVRDAEYESALRRIMAAHAAALAAARDRYSDAEREGWNELVADAQAGGGACIEQYAARIGVSVSDAISRVLQARDSYRRAYGDATGTLTALRDRADALYADGDVDGLRTLGWPA